MTENKFVKDYLDFLNKYIGVFAIILIILLGGLGIALYKDSQLKEEINKNCGFETEDYRCYCDKSKVEDIEEMLEFTKQIRSGNIEGLNISFEK